MRYRLVMWDFDGTLADTLPGLLVAYNELAAKHGFRPVQDPEAARRLTPRAFLASHDIPLFKLPLVLKELFAARRHGMADTRLVPGLPEALQAIHRAGCRMAVLSSNTRENVQTCLRANGVEGLFGEVVGYSHLFGKARPMRRLVASHVGRPGEAVYVGDELRDVEAAREAGVAVAAVTWGLNDRGLLAAARPDYLIERPEELCRVLV
jgi:phosphoglycolate phosphatase